MYNFDEIIERQGTNALNTDGFRDYIFHAGPEKTFPYKDDEFVRMWVADMEFATPDVIRDAIKERIDKKIFGYSMVYSDDYYQAFSKWCKEKYNWEFLKEELCFSPGIIPALYQLIEDLVGKDEKMLVMTPGYGYFKHAAEYNKVELVKSPLIETDGYFTIDFEDLEKRATDPKVKVLLWCNPHNPSGRMWTMEDLKKVAEIAKKNNLWLISDEIHCDLIRKGKKHIPMGLAEPEYNKLITCMSASKTFNMAGLMFSDIIIRNEEERARFKDRDKIVGFVNPLSVAAHKAAYEKGGQWLMELREYLDQNFAYEKAYLDQNFPEAKFQIPEATYLAWVNMGRCLPEIEDFPDFFANNAGVLLEGGDDLFVGNAKGYIRLNLAMPRSIIEKGLNRMKEALKENQVCK